MARSLKGKMATGPKCIFELKENIIEKMRTYNILVPDLTGVSGSLVVVAVLLLIA